MLQVKLVGSETCHRYKLMRDLVLQESARLGVPVQMVEETEIAGILTYNTVNLPLLFIDGEKVAQGNPPSRSRVRQHLQKLH